MKYANLVPSTVETNIKDVGIRINVGYIEWYMYYAGVQTMVVDLLKV